MKKEVMAYKKITQKKKQAEKEKEKPIVKKEMGKDYKSKNVKATSKTFQVGGNKLNFRERKKQELLEKMKEEDEEDYIEITVTKRVYDGLLEK